MLFGNSLAFAFGERLQHSYAWTAQPTGATAVLFALAADSSENVLAAGSLFQLGNEGYQSDILLVKLDRNGSEVWSYLVGGPGEDEAKGLGTDRDGNVYLCGTFQNHVDFDPGPEVDLKAAPTAHPSLRNAFISKLTSDGTYQWTRSFQWEGDSADGFGDALSWLPPDRLIVVGRFGGPIDFDPGAGVAPYSGGPTGMYVLELTTEGEFVSIGEFGGATASYPTHVLSDAAGNIFYSTVFRGRVDFDPTPGTDYRNAATIRDNFSVTKLNSDLSYAWTVTYRVWKGALAVTPEGEVVVSGWLIGTVDFDPGPGEVLRTATRPGPGELERDTFVTKLNPDGAHVWTYTIGETSLDGGDSVAVDRDGGVLVNGHWFGGSMDFDASERVEEHVCNGFQCNFLLRLHAEGSFDWVKLTQHTANFFGPPPIAVDSANNIYFARDVQYSTDVDPTCEIDERDPLAQGGSSRFLTKLVYQSRTADYDKDGDVDLFDLAAHQNCFAGEGSDTCQPGCDVFDLNPDNALDLADFAALVALLGGPR